MQVGPIERGSRKSLLEVQRCSACRRFCVTCARLWRVSSIREWDGFVFAIGWRSHVVPLNPDRSAITLCNFSIFEVILQPGGDYALHCIRHSSDQARLLFAFGIRF